MRSVKAFVHCNFCSLSRDTKAGLRNLGFLVVAAKLNECTAPES